MSASNDKKRTNEVIDEQLRPSKKTSNDETTESIKILLVSDIHNFIQHLERVRIILDKQKLNVDIVLSPGDLVNIKTPEEYASEDFQLESLRKVEEIGQALLQFAPKVYLLPGNVSTGDWTINAPISTILQPCLITS